LDEIDEGAGASTIEKMPELNPPVQATFEAGLDELERVVKEMESGDLPLERSLELFEKGMALSEACRKQLEEAETRVEKLLDRGNRVDVEPASFK
jgi:exodeoxyribonuclease VII small subunit